MSLRCDTGFACVSLLVPGLSLRAHPVQAVKHRLTRSHTLVTWVCYTSISDWWAYSIQTDTHTLTAGLDSYAEIIGPHYKTRPICHLCAYN